MLREDQMITRPNILAAATASLLFAAPVLAQSTPPAGSLGGTPVETRSGAALPLHYGGTPPAGALGRSVPRPHWPNDLPVTAATGQSQYLAMTGERLGNWNARVDTFMDLGRDKSATLQVKEELQTAWNDVNGKFDALSTAPSANWTSARTAFETAWAAFKAKWDGVQS